MASAVATRKLLRVEPSAEFIKSEEFTTILAARGFQRIFIEMTAAKEQMAVFYHCLEIANKLRELDIRLFNPIVVSVYKLPRSDQRETLHYLSNRGIHVTLESFDDYAKEM